MDYNVTYREKDKGLQVIISYKDELGKWKQKSKQGFPNTREGKKQSKIWADETLQLLKNNAEINLDDDFKNITFKQFYDMYIEHIKLHLAVNTVENYECALLKFNKLDNIELCKLTNLHIQMCIDDMLKGSIKRSTIQIYIRRINTLLNSACKEYKIIASNPICNIKIEADKFQKEKVALASYQLDDLLAKLSQLKKSMKKYYIASLLASKCGLRLGEICGLKIYDINFKDCLIKIERQLKQNHNKEWILGPLKSKNSYRNVPFSDSVKIPLLNYINNTPINIDGSLFKTTNDSLGNNICKIYKKLGYDISIHELRHTYATLLIGNGMDFKTAAKILGHDANETMKTYSHVTDEMMKKATDLINNIF